MVLESVLLALQHAVSTTACC